MSRPTSLPRARLSALVAAACALALVPSPAHAQDKAGPALTHTPVTQGFQGEPLTITATIVDESGVFAPTVHFRPLGAKSFTDVIMSVQSANLYVAQVTSPGDLEYWIEAFDDAGNGPSRAGSETKPFRVALVAKPPAPVVAAPAAAVAVVPVAAAPAPAASPAGVDLSLPTEELLAIPLDPDVAAVPEAALEGLDDVAEAQEPFFTKWWFWAGAGGATAVAATLLVVALQPAPVLQNQMGSVAVLRP